MPFFSDLNFILQSGLLICQVRRWGKLVAEQRVSFDDEPLSWQPTLDTFLSDYPSISTCRLQLGAPYVQWFTAIWPATITNKNDLTAYLQYQANQHLGSQSFHHGASATPPTTDWQVGFHARAQPGESLLVAAIDASLLLQWQSRVVSHHKKLKSVQPLLLSSWPKDIQRVNSSTLLAFEEPPLTTLVAYQDQTCFGVRIVRRLSNDRAQVEQYAKALSFAVDAIRYVQVKP